ncbi:uncharacterized protein V1516DRAFT_661849 [Lipomyces oligophaga]|uniref:uncharacterized protein n=1 Tax=Lipomyces oligophaga TaxID=45792 RepID=UPI0034CE9324
MDKGTRLTTIPKLVTAADINNWQRYRFIGKVEHYDSALCILTVTDSVSDSDLYTASVNVEVPLLDTKRFNIACTQREAWVNIIGRVTANDTERNTIEVTAVLVWEFTNSRLLESRQLLRDLIAAREDNSNQI